MPLIERHDTHVRLHPAGPLHGDVTPPGSKSLTNRYLACAALAHGPTTLRGVSLSDDAHAMLAGLNALGVPHETSPAGLILHGCRGAWPVGDAELNVGHAGTAMRFLTALASLGFGQYTLDGSPRMRARPIGGLVDALRQLGAQIGYAGVEGYPPLTIAARGLLGGEVAFDEPPSSQFLSALLMIAPCARHDVLISVAGDLPSEPYVQMTLDVMRDLGADAVVSDDFRRFVVPALQPYNAGEYTVEPDASAASYFWAAAAITGGRVRVCGLTRASHQGDVGFVDVLAHMGCDVAQDANGLTVSAPPSGRLHGVDVDLNAMPDTVQTLAVTALFAAGPTHIRNVANLRIKETDRIAALATELTRLGARVETTADSLTIHPPATVRPASISTYDDHRMAMSFALAGLVIDGIEIRAAGCVSKSVPNYFDLLATLARHTPGD